MQLDQTNNNQNQNKNLPNRYILLIMLILCVVCILLAYTGTNVSSPMRTAAGYFFTPIEKGIYTVGTWIYDRSTTLKTMDSLRSENAELRAELASLKEELVLLREEEYELARLQKLYELDSQYASYNKVGANVIAKSSSSWFSSFTIDKGENQGIAVGMNVIADGGLVGIVTDVSANFATVTSIVDDTSSVSATILSSGDNCIVSGSLSGMTQDGTISFSNLDDTDDIIMEGDEVVVSNISDKYMSGIVIGYVTQVNESDNRLTKSGRITPAVDFKHLFTVLVITDLKYTHD